jgi:hypothetical protein
MIPTNKDKWMSSYLHGDGRPSITEEKGYLNLVGEDKNSECHQTVKYRKRKSEVEFARVFRPSYGHADSGKKRVIHELDADKIISEKVEIVDSFGNKNDGHRRRVKPNTLRP